MEKRSYKELIQERISYSDLLTTKEWLNRYKSIIERDNYKCTICGKTETFEHQNDEFPYDTIHIFSPTVHIIADIVDYVPKFIPADKPYSLHVHHEYYVLNKLPWEYPDEALITVCNWCHYDIHSQMTIKIYSENFEEHVHLENCIKCDGKGWFSEYHGVEDGICYECHGTGYQNLR